VVFHGLEGPSLDLVVLLVGLVVLPCGHVLDHLTGGFFGNLSSASESVMTRRSAGRPDVPSWGARPNQSGRANVSLDMIRATMRGTLTTIDHGAECGVLRDEEGCDWRFRREDMVFWFDFAALGLGDVVRFEPKIGPTGRRSAVNVQRPEDTALS